MIERRKPSQAQRCCRTGLSLRGGGSRRNHCFEIIVDERMTNSKEILRMRQSYDQFMINL